MKKTLSLKDPKEFQRAIKKGSWYGGNLISTYILSNNTDFNHIGLAVGKKAGKAVKRNKIKRIIRAVYFELEEYLIEEQSHTFVFVWKSKAVFSELSFEAIKRDIERAFTKAGLLK